MVQNLISFYSFDQELSMGLKITLLKLREKNKQFKPPLLSASVAPYNNPNDAEN